MNVELTRQIIIDVLEELKARDIVTLDVRRFNSLFDYMIVASAESTRQTRAFVHHVHDRLLEVGARVQGVEGETTGEWVLVDLGEVVVHVMQPAVRAYYNLEQLWGGPAATAPVRRPSTPASLQPGAA